MDRRKRSYRFVQSEDYFTVNMTLKVYVISDLVAIIKRRQWYPLQYSTSAIMGNLKTMLATY